MFHANIKNGVQPFVACQASGYRQVTCTYNKHRKAHANIGMNLLSACSRMCENWRYSKLGEQELKAQYFNILKVGTETHVS